MSAYLNLETGEYPRHIGDLYLLGYKDEEELPEGWVQVVPTENPAPGVDQKAIEVAPKLINGIWTQQWEVVDLTTEEIARRDNQLDPLT
jgi:hypothetical protein